MRLSRVAPAVRTILGKRAHMCTPYPVHAAEEGMRNKALENTLTRLFRDETTGCPTVSAPTLIAYIFGIH